MPTRLQVVRGLREDLTQILKRVAKQMNQSTKDGVRHGD